MKMLKLILHVVQCSCLLRLKPFNFVIRCYYLDVYCAVIVCVSYPLTRTILHFVSLLL